MAGSNSWRVLATIDKMLTKQHLDRSAVSHKVVCNSPFTDDIEAKSHPLYSSMSASYDTAMLFTEIIPVAVHFPNDKFTSFGVFANRGFKCGEIVPGVLGFLSNIPFDDPIGKENEFSVYQSDRNNGDILMLGVLSFVNSSCKPNCVYHGHDKKKGIVYLKVVSPSGLSEGEELTVKYRGSFFGLNNVNCMCPFVECHGSAPVVFTDLARTRGQRKVCKLNVHPQFSPVISSVIETETILPPTGVQCVAELPDIDHPTVFPLFSDTFAISDVDPVIVSAVDISYAAETQTFWPSIVVQQVADVPDIDPTNIAPSLAGTSAVVANVSKRTLSYRVRDFAAAGKRKTKIPFRFKRLRTMLSTKHADSDSGSESSSVASSPSSAEFPSDNSVSSLAPFSCSSSYRSSDSDCAPDPSDFPDSSSDACTDNEPWRSTPVYGAEGDHPDAVFDVASSDSSSNTGQESEPMLYPGSKISLASFSMCFESIATKHCMSDINKQDILKLIKLILPSHNNVPKDKSAAMIGQYVNSYEEVYKSEEGTFIRLDFKQQLLDIVLEHKQVIQDYGDRERTYVIDDMVFPRTSSDANSKNYHLLLNTDGVEIASKVTGWPIWLTVAELPPLLRMAFQNIVLAGLWCGKEKPNWKDVLPNFIGDILNIANLGIKNAGITHYFRPYLLIVDMIAKASLLNMMQFNGSYG